MYGYAAKMTNGNVVVLDKWDSNTNLKNLKALRQRLFVEWHKNKSLPETSLNQIFGG